MSLYIVGRTRGIAFEILSYDKEACTAVLRGRNGIVNDPNFHIYMVRRMYDLTDVEPEYLKGKSDA